jgi:hypothetical protein
MSVSFGRRGSIACAIVAAMTWSASALAQAPVATSPAHVKELVGLLQAKKLEAFAVKDTETPGRFVAVLLVPNAQLMLVSAAYERPTDIEYRIYAKDFMNAYAELNSGIMSKDKFFVEDALCDGLVAKPANGVDDTVTIGAEKHVFNGDYTDPKKKPDPKKPNQDQYFKVFADADARYTKLLSMLVDELKKIEAPLGPAHEVR